jgi:hypothetical protein
MAEETLSMDSSFKSFFTGHDWQQKKVLYDGLSDRRLANQHYCMARLVRNTTSPVIVPCFSTWQTEAMSTKESTSTPQPKLFGQLIANILGYGRLTLLKLLHLGQLNEQNPYSKEWLASLPLSSCCSPPYSKFKALLCLKN